MKLSAADLFLFLVKWRKFIAVNIVVVAVVLAADPVDKVFVAQSILKQLDDAVLGDAFTLADVRMVHGSCSWK